MCLSAYQGSYSSGAWGFPMASSQVLKTFNNIFLTGHMIQNNMLNSCTLDQLDSSETGNNTSAHKDMLNPMVNITAD